MFSRVLTVAAVLSLLYAVYYRLTRRSHSLPYPPGPKPRPIIGNLRDIPSSSEWVTYAQWGKDYGNIVHLSVLGSSIVVLNSAEVANDLLEKKGSIYSDRPRLPMINELMGWDWNLALMPYGQRFAVHRRIVQQQFQPSVVAKSYYPIIARETRILLNNLADNPAKYFQHLRRTAGAIVMMIVYGHQVAPQGDEFVSLAEETRDVGAIVGAPGAYLVDILPFLKYVPTWVPGARFKKQAKEWRWLAEDMRGRPYQMVKEQMASGTALPSMITSLLDSDVNTAGYERDEIIMNSAGMVYSAAADTTVAALANFFLAMQLHPQVQKKAQLEIDAVTQGQRLPNFTDRDSLPYIDCIVKEVIRLYPVSPLGVPHRTTEDDFYKGMFIPRGSTVIANIWAILHDDAIYQDPHSFIPERFLPNESQATGALDPGRAAFGFGRRVCPGRHMAEASIWIAIAYILSAFDITPALDENRREIVPQVKWSSGLVAIPTPFGCTIKPRLEGALDSIRQC